MALATQTSAQPSSDILLVANQGDHTISLIDPASGNLVKTIATHGDHTHEIAVSPDSRVAYLPI
jgi:DNA-binding beta-propeller fold protein YncE